MRLRWVSILVALAHVGCGHRALSSSGDGLDRPPDGPRPERQRPDQPQPRPTPTPGWAPIKPGTFLMGSPVGEPCREQAGVKETQHAVTLTRAFELATTEVTQAEYQKSGQVNPAKHASCGPSCPVEQVTWHEAAAYCNWLSKTAGLPTCYTCYGSGKDVGCEPAPGLGAGSQIYTCRGYRLPTEAEWEYAYRAGTKTSLYNGALADCAQDPLANAIGWYAANSGLAPHPAAQKQPNAWGLHDLAGNVWEWCHDWYTPDLGPAAVTDPAGPAAASTRVIRGSSWLDQAGNLRAADRFAYPSLSRNSNIGFRCARTL